MKKLLTLFAATLMALVPAAAGNQPEAAQMETKTFQVASFDGLDVSWIYHVELTKSSRQSVEVEAPDFVMPYLQVKVREKTLALGIANLPVDVRRKLERGNYEVTARVSMPELKDLEMSGASKLVAEGDFQTPRFEMELSGASSFRDLRMKADQADIECSGASKFQLKGQLKEIKMDLSGASKGTLESSGDKINMDMSGSSKLELTGVYGSIKTDVSAASHLTVKGALDSIRLYGSGAAKIDLMESPVKEAWVELSGAASARIFVQEKLGVHLSGAAKCQYKSGDRLQITEMDVDRAASLKKL